MSKRQKFLLTSIFLALGISFLPTLEAPLRFGGIGGIFLLTLFLSGWALSHRALNLLILPSFLSLGASITYPLLPLRPLLNGLFLAGFIFLFYLSLLTQNIFKVASEKVIPLLRAAQTICFLLTIFAVFLNFTAFYKLDLSITSQLVLVLVTSLFLSWQALGVMKLGGGGNRGQIVLISLLLGLGILEISLGLGLFPLKALMRALFLTTCFYVGLGIAQHYLRHSLTRRVIGEYLLTALCVGLVLVVF